MTPEQKRRDTIENVILFVLCLLFLPVYVCWELMKLDCKGGKFFR